MDAKQFIAEFGHIAQAPGGVARLRQMVLSLAIQGKLDCSNKSDTAIAVTLKALENRRKEIIAEHNLSATKKHKNLGKAKGTFVIPHHWSWEFLGYISSWPLKDGDWVESKDQNPNGGVRLLQLADIGVGEYKNKSAKFLTEEKAEELNCYFLRNGDVLIARLPDPLGRACIFPGDDKPCVTVVDVAVCRVEESYVNPAYLVHCINSLEIQKQIESLATGTTRKRVATGKLGALPLPLPPLEEQSRIVAKADELMALCDQLEKQQQQKRALQNQLRQASLQAVATATSPFELKQHWQRLEANFQHLFSQPESVRELRSLVMSLGVQGLLTEQISNLRDKNHFDSIIDDFLKYMPQGKSKKQPNYKTVGHTEFDSQIPSSWNAIRFGQLVRVINGRAYKKTELLNRGTPVLRVGNLFTSNQWYYSDLELEEDKYCDEGDLIFAWSASFGPFIWEGPRVIYHYHIWKLDIYSASNVDKEFLYLYLLEKTASIKEAGHGISMAHMTKAKMEQLPVPIPTLSEQKEIVSRVKTLLSVCDDLEKKIKSANTVSEHLVTAAVATLTGIQTPEEDTPLKAPQTELVAPVKLGANTPDKKDNAPLAALISRANGEIQAQDLWQRFGGEIDAFYAQLKTEIAHGWIAEPAAGQMLEKEAEAKTA